MSRRPPSRRRTRRRARLESLENRRLLATLVVTDLNDGTLASLEGDGQLSLREALHAANTDTSIDGSPAGSGQDEIVFAAGLRGGIRLSAGRLEVTDSLVIAGHDGGAITLGGEETTQILYIGETADDVAISELTFYQGNASNGGAIENHAGSLTLDSLYFWDNVSSNNGAAIFHAGGAMQVRNSRLRTNEAGGSGAGIYASGGAVEISGSTLERNTAAVDGGGIYSESASLTVIDSTIEENLAGNNGGGLANAAGILTIQTSEFAGNAATDGHGGGILSHDDTDLVGTSIYFNSAGGVGGGLWSDGRMTVTNSSISVNSSKGSGGGIYNHSGMLTATHVSIVRNRADVDYSGDDARGGGVMTSEEDSAVTYLFNSILVDNKIRIEELEHTSNDIDGKDVESISANNLISDPLTAGGLAEGVAGNLVGDGNGEFLEYSEIIERSVTPRYGGTHTWLLASGSRAIDAGDNTFTTTPGADGLPGTGDEGEVPLAVGQRNAPFVRIDGARVDIGASEQQIYRPEDFVVNTTADRLSTNEVSLRGALLFAEDHAGPDTITFGGVTFADDIADTIELELGALNGWGAISIVGPGADLLTIRGNGQNNIFTFGDRNNEQQLSGVTITQGTVTGLSNSGNLTIADSRIVGNTNPHLLGRGAGIHNGRNLVILRSTIEGNSGSGAIGGGVHNSGTLTIVDSTIANNHASIGGALFNSAGDVKIVNSTLSGNTTLDGGGAIYNNTGNIAVFNSTIVGNRSRLQSGAGVRSNPNRETSLSLFNSIVLGNLRKFDDEDAGVPSDVAGRAIEPESAGNLIGSDQGPPLDAVVDPVLADNGGVTLTHALIAGSPAIDAGDGSLLPADTEDIDGDGNTSELIPFDQRGQQRVVSRLDIGAYEIADPTVPVVIAPEDLTIEGDTHGGATQSSAAEFLAAASALDEMGQSIAVMHDAPSVFPVGMTTVTFTATDGSGKIGRASVVVTVKDTAAPNLFVPSDIVVDADVAGGATLGLTTVADFLSAANASDVVDADPAITNDAPPVFPFGETVVTFTASDDSGNEQTATATVTVNGEMAAPVIELVSPAGIEDPVDLPSGEQPTTWSEQRSDLREIVLDFELPIFPPSAADIILTNLGVNAPVDADQVVPLSDDQISLSSDGKELRIEFSGNELPDGVYQLELMSQVTGSMPVTIKGDVGNQLYTLSGDWNGSGGVNIQDFATFAYWFGNTVGTAPEYVDLNGSGGINIQDFAGFAANFGKGLVFPDGASDGSAGGEGEGELESALRTLLNPTDVNGDGAVTAIDALRVINHLADGDARTAGWKPSDVTRDGAVTELDALRVIEVLVDQRPLGQESLTMHLDELDILRGDDDSKDTIEQLLTDAAIVECFS